MLDEKEFLSPYGIRSLSRYHAEHPYVLSAGDQQYRVGYLPAESDTGVFGGNSNWRGPIRMAVNALLIRALMHYYAYYGDNFKIECPTGSGKLMNLFEVAREIANRLTRIFLRDEAGDGRYSGAPKNFSAIPNGAIICCSTNIPWRQWCRPRRQPPDGMDWRRRAPDRNLWQARCKDLSTGRPRGNLWAREGKGVVLDLRPSSPYPPTSEGRHPGEAYEDKAHPV